MQGVCGHCGEVMIQGQIFTTGVGLGDGMGLSFLVSTGTPTSLNPIKAVLQGMREEPAYREETCTIRGRVCPRCGQLEFFIDAADLTRVSALAGPPSTK